ncbi:MAG: rhodanese-like domain-containing protein [Desulfobaccales bacterium]
MAQQLMKMGFPPVMVLEGGYPGWKRRGYPIEAKKDEG